MSVPRTRLPALAASALLAALASLPILAGCAAARDTTGARESAPKIAATKPITSASAPRPDVPSEPPAVPAGLLARCKAAAEYSRRNDGHVMLVMLDGRLVFADAAPGHAVDAPHLLASGTKSFAGTAAMLAVADGLLSLDERVSDTIDEWKGDPRKSKVTVRQLLTLSAGIEPLSSTVGTVAGARAAGVRDRAATSIAARSVAPPGERFLYGPSSFYVFGELLSRKLEAAGTGDADAVAYLERRLFRALGIRPSFFRDDAGNPNLAGGCRISAIEWARFGELIRNGGTLDGQTLLAPELVGELGRASGANPRYGLTWWLIHSDSDTGGDEAEQELALALAADRLEESRRPAGRRMAERLRERANESMEAVASSEPLGVVAAGKGKQKLYVLPQRGMTVVRFGDVNGSRGFRNEEFLRILLGSTDGTTGAGDVPGTRW